MLKIGDFSKLSRVSIRMLRHYDDIGLLKPAQIYEDTEHVKLQTLPAVKVASYILKGSYEGINDATAIVVSWMKDNGYTVSGPMFNIYHVGPAQTQNPDEFVTEICFPIA